MAKFAAILIAAFAFQAALAGTTEEPQNPLLRTFKKRNQAIGPDAITTVEGIQPDQHRGRRAIAEAANEYSHDIQIAVYHLHQLIFHNHEGHAYTVLAGVVQKLSDAGHNIQKSVRSQPDEIKNVLKSNIPTVVGETDKLIRIANEQHQIAKEGHNNIAQELEDVLNALLDATRQLKIRGEIQQLTHQQVKERVQQITNDITSDIQKITAHDEETLHDLVHEVHQLSHRIDAGVSRIQREIHHQKGETKDTLRLVAVKLDDIHTSLETVANSHQGTPEARVTELKAQLKSNVHNAAAQVERLVQLAETVNQTETRGQDVIDLVKNIVARSLSGSHHLHKQLQAIAGVHEEN